MVPFIRGSMPASLPELLTRGPVPLAADNFTPLARTPWAGEELGRRVKQRVPGAAGARIGEAWEFSCDPAFPSRVLETGETLLSLMERYPDAILSPAQPRGCEILVKLLDAGEPLSLQVHPRDDDPALAAGECGKPESWLVLAAAPGAGIYLGFSRAVSKDELRTALEAGDAARPLLHFEPVEPGDYFEIEPGVPHAIGPGVTLLEPQRVIPGKAGKTFRMWDWGRLEGGKARPLHVEEGLRIIDPERQVGAAFAASLRRRPQLLAEKNGVVVTGFAGNGHYRTLIVRAEAAAAFQWSIHDGYGALIMLAGTLETQGIVLGAGQPALLPWAAMPLSSRVAAHTAFAIVIPRGASLALDL